MQYFVLPKCCLAFNAKVASTALACSIVKKYYPDKLQECLDRFNSVASRLPPEFIEKLPESIQHTIKNDKLDSAAFWQNVCVKVNVPDKPVFLLVREPVDRFISAVAHLQIDPEKTLTALENNEKMIFQVLMRNARNDTHLLPQHIYNSPFTKLYKFPNQIEQLCKDADIDYPLPKVNEGKYTKPILTKDQIKRVKKYYKEDVILFDSIE